jgi:uncharacterized small protein (DUF1192 family)
MNLNANALLWMIGNMAAQLAALQEENTALKAELAKED